MPLMHSKSGLLVDAYLTYEERFGRRSSIEEFRRELARYRSEDVIRLCSALNILLFGWSKYFDKDLHDRLVSTFAPAALVAIKSNPARVLFHRQQLLFTAKEAIRLARDAANPLSGGNDLSDLFTMANDQLVGAEPGSRDEAKNPIRLISQFLTVSEFQFEGHVARLFRPYVVLSKLNELLPQEGKRFDLVRMFEETVGLRPDVYFPLVFACMAKYQPLTADDFYRSPQSFALRRDWFSQTKLENAHLERLVADISGDYAEFQGLLARYDKGVNDFTIFRERPLVRLGDSIYPLDFGFLAAKAESAFFWRAHNSLPSSERDDFHAFWGHVFERYMHRLMRNVCTSPVNQYCESPRYADGDQGEACDGIVLCKGHIAVVAEYEGSVFTAEAKYAGDLAALQGEIEKKLIGRPDRDRKGVHQLANAISSLFAKGTHRTLRDVDLPTITKVFPLLITRDEIGSTWYLASYLNKVFRKAVNRNAIRPIVSPVFSMSVDHFEAFAGALRTVSLSDILEARYRQDRELQMPFLLPNNEALKGTGFAAAPTIEEAGQELTSYARRLFENPH